MPDKGDYHGCDPSDQHAKMPVMSTIQESDQVGERRALMLVANPQPWYATTPATPPAFDRSELEDEHTRTLAQAVGDHLPYELALRAAELAAQLQRTA